MIKILSRLRNYLWPSLRHRAASRSASGSTEFATTELIKVSP